MKLRTLRVVLAVAPALVAACGGSATDDLARATPSFDSMSMDISDLDAQAPATSTALTIADAADLTAADACHPHLFLRTHEIVDATNEAIWHILRPMAWPAASLHAATTGAQASGSASSTGSPFATRSTRPAINRSAPSWT